MKTTFVTLGLAIGLGAMAIAAQRPPDRDDTAAPPTLRALWDSATLVVVAKVGRSESRMIHDENQRTLGSPDTRVTEFQVQVLDSIKGRAFGDPLKVVIGGPGDAQARAIIVNWKSGQDIVLFLKPGAERGTYKLAGGAAGAYPIRSGAVEIPESVRARYFGGQVTIAKEPFLQKVRELARGSL